MTIFVNIASYRDPQCEPTVRDLFAKALHPDAINVVAVVQEIDGDGGCFSHPRTKVISVSTSDSLGVCWARSIGYQLLTDEDYILQIDSHTLFAEHWDDVLQQQLALCPSPTSILTTYPPAFLPPDTKLSDGPTALAAVLFDERGLLAQMGWHFAQRTTPQPAALVSGGFIFGSSQWIKECPYDPYLYFHSEEITLAVRLWTLGWDLFSPTVPVVWHYYDRANRQSHWEDYPVCAAEREEQSILRMGHLLQQHVAPDSALVDIEKYGLGHARSLADYERFAGIDFKRRTIARAAKQGRFGPLLPSRGVG